MPKPGLKYFIGSFLLSLAAVFVATKAYLVVMWSEQEQEKVLAAVKPQDIELFAPTEENDPIYEKYQQITQIEQPLEESDAETISEVSAQELALGDYADEILYTPENDESAEFAEDESTVISQNESSAPETEIIDADNVDNSDDEELQIADAQSAPVFMIPLKHNFNIEGGNVTVSDSAGNGQIALASHDVSLYNLGTENQADVTEPLTANAEQNIADDNSPIESQTNQSETLTAEVSTPQMADDNPWEVAEVANKYTPKNSLSVKSEPEKADVALPAQEAKTAYKMQKNILIPIPEDIMNDENLTPQFSTSEENLKLEEELRAKHKLPTLPASPTTKPAADGNDTNINTDNPEKVAPQSLPQPIRIPSDDTEKDFDEDEETQNDADAQTSKNLTESVAAWFSGIKNKVTTNTNQEKTTDNSGIAGEKSAKSGTSIFQRLLGTPEPEKNIAPSELKITFQPNRAEISGQTLEWLRAFADNTLENENVVVEIRVSQSTPAAIRYKRLKLLYKVLADNGVEPMKVNTIFTNREPNSFIIRNVRYSSEEEMAKAVVKWGDNPW